MILLIIIAQTMF